ncbi:helix-turn-helix domain-containing protein [Ktedonosporobacter rubrisoli]|uniref:Helix-turn-helix domain-containing protein n=1 Tax=Ktedonosporobacter rubrisoli TaxID=2509675 RepID=A0A4P6JNM6_KTERU|nr:helix-turn-helix domain-containing protein [Ktedonosporobacter rubrisoli]QBD76773.1 helix-turn-helix domain-containing protein [Ktedonosporobacter rubrisoli]
MGKERNEFLKHEREQRGWSQARLAELIETDAATVSRWERGYAIPSPYFREKLCQLFEKDAQDLGFLRSEPAESYQDASLPFTLDQQDSRDASCQESSVAQGPEQTIYSVDWHSRRLASLSYLLGWISGLFMFLLMRKNRFVLFHSLQAFLFFVGSQILFLILLVLLYLLDAGHERWQEYVGMGLALFLLISMLFTFIVWVIGMVQAWRGKPYQLPFVGNLSEQAIAKRFRL